MEAERRALSNYSSDEKRALLAQLLEKKARAPKRAPLSLGQERLWFIDQLTPGNSAYNMFAAVRLKGDFNVTALEKSFNEIIRRHEILRTSFPSLDGTPVQVIAAAATLTLPLFDLSSLPEEEREAEAKRLAQEESHRPFVLAEAPLLRATVLRLGDQEHAVLVTMHHIVSDGWSLDIFMREMRILYQAFRAYQDSPLAELPLQFSDFAKWQREWLRGEVLESLLSYWKSKLEGIPLLLNLPTDHPRPLMKGFRGAGRGLRISGDLWEALKEFNRREGVTMFMTLLSAFQTLLYRYSAQDDINVGIPISGRQRLETQSLIGFFLNTLVIRARFKDELTFRDVLRQTKESVLEAHEHQDLPFEKLVEALHPKRSLSYEPIMQVAFVFVVALSKDENASELKAESLSTRNDTAKYDVTLYVQEAMDTCMLDIQYSADLFDAATIARMLSHYEVILREIVANPGQQISKLRLLLDSEREQMLAEWNDTRRAYASDKCVNELFEQQTALTPRAEALVCGDDRLTYEDLNRRANQLAHHLRSLGVGPETLIGVMMERRVELVIAVLSILKAGAAFIPLDPAYPAKRLRFMIDDSRASVLLTQSTLLEKLPAEHAVRAICLDTDWVPITAGLPDTNPEVLAQPENLAYVIYTSGSTGKPKGVMIQHRGLCNLAKAQTEAFGVGRDSRVLQFASISFDASVWEIFMALLAGAGLYLESRDSLIPGPELIRTLRESQITTVTLPPSALAVMEREQLPALKMIITAGESCTLETARRWIEGDEQLRFFNAYGPTEFTVCATIGELDGSRITIGGPIANAQTYILDANLQPVPIGVYGELHLGGVALARGYLNRPELTAEKFIPNPFSLNVMDAGQRLYKTGDLARWLPDGNIEFFGRIDNQLKVRGYRIEAGEIETLLNKHPEVRASVVVARQNVAGEKQLAAYCVPQRIDEGFQPDALVRILRSYLKETLPDYMIPSFITTIDALPLTPNGKVDHKALPEPGEIVKGRSYVAPYNALESQLAQMWEELLGVTPVGIRENFFELGGHSLLAVRLMAKIRKQFGKDLPISALFNNETVEELAKVLSEGSSAWRFSPLVPIQPQGTKPRFFCVHAIGGNVNNYYLLARYLGTDQPFYGLQAPPLHEVTDDDAQVEKMAARYVEAVREVQPVGPYMLGGYSFGGFVAYEMARQLRTAGQDVSLLALFDTYSSIYLNRLPQAFDVAEMLVALAWTTSREKGKHVVLPVDELRRLSFDDQLDFFLEKMRAEDLVPAEVDHELLSRFLGGYTARHRAAREYVPQPYPGRVTVFRCKERDPLWIQRLLEAGLDPDDPTLAWKGLSSEPVSVIEIPGHHEVICDEPYVQSLAASLSACLELATRSNEEQPALAAQSIAS